MQPLNDFPCLVCFPLRAYPTLELLCLFVALYLSSSYKRKRISVAFQVDVLVYNCGGGGFGIPILDIDPETFKSSFDASCVGALLCSQAVLPGMLASEGSGDFKVKKKGTLIFSSVSWPQVRLVMAFRMLDVVAVRCGRCSRHCTCGANIEVDYVGVKRCSINFNQPETTVRQRLLSAVAMAPPNLPVENMLCELCRSPSPKSLANRASIQFMCDLMLSLIHRDPRRRCQRCTPHTRPGVQNHVFFPLMCVF